MRNNTDKFVQNGSHTAEVEKPKSQSFAQHIAGTISLWNIIAYIPTMTCHYTMCRDGLFKMSSCYLQSFWHTYSILGMGEAFSLFSSW